MKALSIWRQSKPGLLVFGLAELALAYVFFLWATDSGSLLDWAFVVFLVLAGIYDLIRFFGKAAGDEPK